MCGDYSMTRSALRASLHPDVVFLAALLGFVSACAWAGYSGSLDSAVLFFTSAFLAGGAALSVELRRERPTVAILASIAAAAGWFVLGPVVSPFLLSVILAAAAGFLWGLR